MRFGLAWLLLFVAAACVGLATYREHGMDRLWLLIPPASCAIACVILWRKNWRVASGSVLGCYLAVWALTFAVGAPRALGFVEQRLTSIRWGFTHDFGPFRRAECDFVLHRDQPELPRPWYFVGNASSPCPLVVSVEHAWRVGGMEGAGGRSYLVWWGEWKSISYRMFWMS